jgi:membrane-bound lytic murein transglycosylase
MGMRYFEIIESAQQAAAQRAQEKRRKARERIADANRRRSAAATHYQDQVKAADDEAKKARASLRETSVRSHALRNRTGALFGWIEPQGYLLQARDRMGKLVGWYDPKLNITRNSKGAVVGTGNWLSALLVSAP